MDETKKQSLKRVLGYGILLGIMGLLFTQFFFALSSPLKNDSSPCSLLDPEFLAIKAQDFSLPDLKGNPRKLSNSLGEVVLLHFWATWCPPCVEELPSLVLLQAQMRRRKFRLVTVSVDEDAAVVEKFFAAYKLPMLPVLLDPTKKTAASFGTEKFPETYLIDKNGIIQYRFVNKRDWNAPSARACIESILEN
ncbi:MAG: TlpA disulfide reductase family protein [Pseudomonadota bacterium]